MAPSRPNGRQQPTWETYRSTIGDRSSLFAAIRDAWSPSTALYLGSYVDLSPSSAIPDVTYVDTDRRAARFFADEDLLASQLRGLSDPIPSTAFLHMDFTSGLPLEPASFDLLISLYTGPAWDSGQQYLAPGGLFLANNSHGDASLAALDPRLTLVAAVKANGDRYRLVRDRLDSYLIPKNPLHADADRVRAQGRGIGFTASAFAYVFRYEGSGE